MALVFFALGVGIAYIVLPFAAPFLLSFLPPDVDRRSTSGATSTS